MIIKITIIITLIMGKVTMIRVAIQVSGNALLRWKHSILSALALIFFQVRKAMVDLMTDEIDGGLF